MLKFPFQINGVGVTYSLIPHTCGVLALITNIAKERVSMLSLSLGTKAKYSTVINREGSGMNSIFVINVIPALSTGCLISLS